MTVEPLAAFTGADVIQKDFYLYKVSDAGHLAGTPPAGMLGTVAN